MVNDCRATVGKPELGKEPSSEFKRMLLIAEHSPIRDLAVKWRWLGIPHWVAVHWVRHKFEKFVQSQRGDRTGVPRSKLSQAEPQDFVGEANVQQLIDVWRKRLCYKCSRETRRLAEDFKRALQERLPEVSAVLVPNCVYRCGCPEPTSCGFWVDFTAWNPEVMQIDATIQERYDIYNKDFAERRGWTA